MIINISWNWSLVRPGGCEFIAVRSSRFILGKWLSKILPLEWIFLLFIFMPIPSYGKITCASFALSLWHRFLFCDICCWFVVEKPVEDKSQFKCSLFLVFCNLAVAVVKRGKGLSFWFSSLDWDLSGGVLLWKLRENRVENCFNWCFARVLWESVDYT